MEGNKKKKNNKVPQHFLRLWKFRLKKKKGREKSDAHSPPFYILEEKIKPAAARKVMQKGGDEK